MLAIVVIILVIQIILGLIVFFVLKTILQKKLIESTLHDLDLFLIKNKVESVEEVVVVSVVEFQPEKKQILQEMLQKRFRPDIKIVYQPDTTLWGGMVLKLGTSVVGKSLRDRLREGGFLKS